MSSVGENKIKWSRGDKRFHRSVKRKGKGRNYDDLYLLYGHSRNIKHLVKIKDVFTSADYSDLKAARLAIPETFSLVDSPGDSFQFLKKLLFSLYNQDRVKIEIDFKDCIKIDLDASICMDIILKDIIYFYKKRSKLGLRNHVQSIRIINTSINIKRFLFSTGAYKNINNFSYTDPDIITYPLCIGFRTHKANDEAREAKKEIDSTNLVDHVVNVMTKMKRPNLSVDTKKYLADIAGEIMTNAEDHSSTNHRYSIGYFEESNNDSEGHHGVFNLVILNFGETIYERLNNPTACKNPEIIDRMKELSSKYTKKRFFGKELSEECLWTLYSLQDGVSSISPHRGNGTIKFIESFFKLKGNNGKDNLSKMTILSGNTSITFDGTYQIGMKLKNNDEYKELTFNKEGSIEVKPDGNYVKFVPNYFPGTIIIAKILIKDDVK